MLAPETIVVAAATIPRVQLGGRQPTIDGVIGMRIAYDHTVILQYVRHSRPFPADKTIRGIPMSLLRTDLTNHDRLTRTIRDVFESHL